MLSAHAGNVRPFLLSYFFTTIGPRVSLVVSMFHSLSHDLRRSSGPGSAAPCDLTECVILGTPPIADPGALGDSLVAGNWAPQCWTLGNLGGAVLGAVLDHVTQRAVATICPESNLPIAFSPSMKFMIGHLRSSPNIRMAIISATTSVWAHTVIANRRTSLGRCANARRLAALSPLSWLPPPTSQL